MYFCHIYYISKDIFISKTNRILLFTAKISTQSQTLLNRKSIYLQYNNQIFLLKRHPLFHLLTDMRLVLHVDRCFHVPNAEYLK